MTQANLVFAKKVYVPAPRAAAKKVGDPLSVIPKDIALTDAGRAFRSIAWDGKAVVEVSLPAPAEAIDVSATARSVFSHIAWTGERPLPPTEGQSKNSVTSILGRFKWE